VFSSTSDPSVVAARAWSWWQQDFFKLITRTKNPPSHPTQKNPKNHQIVLNAKFVLWICRKFEEENVFSSAVCSHSNTYISTSSASSNSPTQHTLVCYPSHCIFTSVRLNETLWSTFCLFVCSSGRTWPFWESFFLWVVFLSKQV
jgi:hypothetical protein